MHLKIHYGHIKITLLYRAKKHRHKVLGGLLESPGAMKKPFNNKMTILKVRSSIQLAPLNECHREG